MRKLILPIAILVLTTAAVINVGCGTSSALSPPPPPPPSPPPTMRLYLSQGSVFNLPITNASIPVATIGSDGSGMAFDATNRLFVANPASGQVQMFTQPIATGTTPALTLATGLCGSGSPHVTYVCEAADVAFDPAGDLLVAGHQTEQVCIVGCHTFNFETIKLVTAPIASSSTGTSISALSSLGQVLGIALDRSGDLWATDGTDLFEYTSPFKSGSVPALTVVEAGVGIAFDGIGNMFVSGSSGVDVFQPPFTAAMTKAFTIKAAGPRYLAFDRAGGLYVTTQAGNLLVFSSPFSAASVPIVTLGIPGAPSNSGVAIGP